MKRDSYIWICICIVLAVGGFLLGRGMFAQDGSSFGFFGSPMAPTEPAPMMSGQSNPPGTGAFIDGFVFPRANTLPDQINSMNRPVRLVSGPASSYIYLFDDQQHERLMNIFDKTTGVAVPFTSWPIALQESSQGRRDIFISPDGTHAVGLNELDAVFFDMKTLKQMQTIMIPYNFMAYKNHNRMLINDGFTNWYGVHPNTKWISDTEFSITLYRVRNYAVTKPWKTMVIDWSK